MSNKRNGLVPLKEKTSFIVFYFCILIVVTSCLVSFVWPSGSQREGTWVQKGEIIFSGEEIFSREELGNKNPGHGEEKFCAVCFCTLDKKYQSPKEKVFTFVLER